MSALEEYRTRIREKDRQLLSIVKERLALGDEVARVKENEGLPTINSDAEKTAMDSISQFAGELGIPIPFARRLGELLIEQTVKVQEQARPPQSKDQILKEMLELTLKMLAQGQTVTRFEVGEPNFPPPQAVVRGLTSAFQKKKIFGYGPAAGLLELRKALAKELNRKHDANIEPDQILITPGARFAIFATATSFVSSLERAIIPQPVWPAYEECVNFVKGRVIPLTTSLENGWEIDLAQLEAELKKGARMLVLNTPNNPTGKSVGKSRFEQIVNLARKYDTMILSDEVYERYVQSPSPSILDTGYENSVYVNTFSKQFGLTGWRIGYLVTTKEKAMRIRRVIQTALTCVPEFIQHAALLALKKARREAQRNVNAIMKKVQLTCRELEKINVSFYKPDGAFYVFPKANKPNFDSVKFAMKLLQEKHVSVSPGQSFGNYPAFFRLAISVPEKQIPGAIRLIGKAIDEWK